MKQLFLIIDRVSGHLRVLYSGLNQLMLIHRKPCIDCIINSKQFFLQFASQKETLVGLHSETKLNSRSLLVFN